MIRWWRAVLLVHATAAFAAAPYVSFTRVVAPAYNLAPAQRIAVIYAIGDNAHLTDFVDDFIDYVDRSGTLRIENAVGANEHIAAFEGADFRKLRREHPADAYVGISLFTCSGTQRGATGSEHDITGARVQRVHVWVDASCLAKLEIRNDNGRRLFTFLAHGEGTSPRGESLTSEERDVAYAQAARYAARSAADSITPRSVRESIELDDTAPSFDEGMAMIDSNRLQDARVIWESALRRNRNSAALNFDLAAVCEASGDLAAARKFYEAAVRLAPANAHYAQEMKRAGERRP